MESLNELRHAWFSVEEVLSGDSGSLFSSCIPIIVKLKNDVSHCPQQSSATLHNVTQKLRELIDHYFFGTEFLNIFSPESLLYCLLDPRFKSLSFVPKDEADAAKQLLVSLHSEVHEKPKVVEENNADEKKKTNYGNYTELILNQKEPPELF